MNNKREECIDILMCVINCNELHFIFHSWRKYFMKSYKGYKIIDINHNSKK